MDTVHRDGRIWNISMMILLLMYLFQIYHRDIKSLVLFIMDCWVSQLMVWLQ